MAVATKEDVDKLNKMEPATQFLTDGGKKGLGDLLDAAITLINEMRADYNALLAKLDADAGVTDTNYAATRAVSAPAVAPLV